MRFIFRLLFLVPLVAFALLTSCSTMPTGPTAEYHVTAHKPKDPSKVRVDLSLSKQNVYVMGGERCFMAAAGSCGLPKKPTPKGRFTIYSKTEHKRASACGYPGPGHQGGPAAAGQ